jgi:hypothetical protein
MFENLQVYQKAVDFADRIATHIESFSRGYYFLADQLSCPSRRPPKKNAIRIRSSPATRPTIPLQKRSLCGERDGGTWYNKDRPPLEHFSV